MTAPLSHSTEAADAMHPLQKPDRHVIYKSALLRVAIVDKAGQRP